MRKPRESLLMADYQEQEGRRWRGGGGRQIEQQLRQLSSEIYVTSAEEWQNLRLGPGDVDGLLSPRGERKKKKKERDGTNVSFSISVTATEKFEPFTMKVWSYLVHGCNHLRMRPVRGDHGVQMDESPPAITDRRISEEGAADRHRGVHLAIFMQMTLHWRRRMNGNCRGEITLCKH